MHMVGLVYAVVMSTADDNRSVARQLPKFPRFFLFCGGNQGEAYKCLGENTCTQGGEAWVQGPGLSDSDRSRSLCLTHTHTLSLLFPGSLHKNFRETAPFQHNSVFQQNCFSAKALQPALVTICTAPVSSAVPFQKALQGAGRFGITDAAWRDHTCISAHWARVAAPA